MHVTDVLWRVRNVDGEPRPTNERNGHQTPRATVKLYCTRETVSPASHLATCWNVSASRTDAGIWPPPPFTAVLPVLNGFFIENVACEVLSKKNVTSSSMKFPDAGIT